MVIRQSLSGPVSLQTRTERFVKQLWVSPATGSNAIPASIKWYQFLKFSQSERGFYSSDNWTVTMRPVQPNPERCSKEEVARLVVGASDELPVCEYLYNTVRAMTSPGRTLNVIPVPWVAVEMTPPSACGGIEPRSLIMRLARPYVLTCYCKSAKMIPASATTIHNISQRRPAAFC